MENNEELDDTLEFLNIVAKASDKKKKLTVPRAYCENNGRMASQWNDYSSAKAHVKKINRGYAGFCGSCNKYHIYTADGVL